ncbi:MAG: regulatory protein GemA [Roseateles sp.]|uniref:gp16 family protein n=1 Tax=Roseateles sp. TaxID=1971397 RepID=UPI0039EBD2FF
MAFKTTLRAERARLVKVIHVARRELAMDEDTYRLMLTNVGGADSTTAMDLRQLNAVLAHLKRKGFRVRRAAPAAPAAAARPDRRQADAPSARKVRALWLFLHRLGGVRDPSERALAAYVKRIAKVDDLHWADGQALHLLVESLKKWAMRYLPAAVKQLCQQLTEITDPARMPAALRALDAAGSRLQRGEGFDAHWWAWEVLCAAAGQPVPADQAAAAPAAGRP